jgi:hypothetical protein
MSSNSSCALINSCNKKDHSFKLEVCLWVSNKKDRLISLVYQKNFNCGRRTSQIRKYIDSPYKFRLNKCATSSLLKNKIQPKKPAAPNYRWFCHEGAEKMLNYNHPNCPMVKNLQIFYGQTGTGGFGICGLILKTL